MLFIRSQFYNILMYIFILIIGLYHIPAAYRSRDGVYKAIYVFAKINRWLLWRICRIKTEIRGKVPAEPALVCSKHMSFLDIVMIADAVPSPQFIMKAELKYVPIIGFFAKQIGSVRVQRGKKSAVVSQMLDDLKKTPKDGQLIIFPQGTRVLPGDKRPYKKGAAAIYQAFDMPVYLAATNVGVLWPRRSFYRYPGTAIIEFLPEPVEPGMDGEEFMVHIADKIETRSDELMAEYPALK